MNEQQRLVVQQALEFASDIEHFRYKGNAEEIITALRKLLEQPEPEPQASAWLYTRNGHEHIFSWDRWGSGVRKGWGETPLTIPPAQPELGPWDLAEKVRRDLDRQSCPGAYMDIAVDSIVKHYTTPPAAQPAVQQEGD